MAIKNGYILALDVGERRVGTAIASPIAKLAQPFKTLDNSDDIWSEILQVIKQEDISTLVVGLPRSLSSQDTQQTLNVRNFAAKLHKLTNIEPVLQDEALTSHQAEAELRARGTKYAKGDIDALAATYILNDYLATIDAMEKRL